MEERFEVETPFGPVWLLGRDTGKPLFVLATGLFAQPWVFDRLQIALPDVDVARFHLPSNHSPPLVPNSIGTIGRALTIAIEARYPGRPTAILGLSAGALVAMAVSAPQVRRLVLVEPFLRTAHIWPLHNVSSRTRSEADRDLLWNVVGVGKGRVEERDYRALLDALTVPTTVIFGDVALGKPRPFTQMPSLADEADRAAFQAHPCVRVLELPGGHNVAAASTIALFPELERAAIAILSEAASA